jgi:hypothetical protein
VRKNGCIERNKEREKSLCDSEREKRRETTPPFVSAKEKFVLLFSPFGKNLFCVKVRSECIEALDFEFFLFTIFVLHDWLVNFFVIAFIYGRTSH